MAGARNHRKGAGRAPLLSGCALAAALAATGHATPAFAQAFQGTPTVTSGSASFSNGAGTTTIIVDTPTAIVNWAPTDTATGGPPIDFLPSGNVASFVNGSIGDYTILNRVLPADPTRAIQFNGTVQSSVSGNPGGSVWFYSPGGIIAGASAVFDVGSLVLTANDIDTTGGLFGPTGEIRFRGATDSRSAVTIQPGAQITASGFGSYVALVAPRVTQSGTVTASGSIAYVAAESADITINGGLFDIAIQTGSNVNAGGETTLTHSGTTTGPSPASPSETRAIYLMAMPKNDAVTMLVTGNVGYQPAVTVGVDNGTVVLSSGYNLTSIDNGAGGVVFNIAPGPASGINASFELAGGAVTSNLFGYARTDAQATARIGGSLSFSGLAALHGGRTASLVAALNETITVGGNLFLTSFNQNASGAFSPGTAALRSLNTGTVTVTGNASLIATQTASTGSAQGGSAAVEVTGAALTVGGNLSVEAWAVGAAGPGNGGAATGGAASLTITNGTLTAQDVSLDASAQGANGAFSSTAPGSGGAGTGGTAIITLSGPGSAIDAATVSVNASATGGDGGGSDVLAIGAAAGAATGGTARVSINGGQFDADFLDIYANADSGNGGFGIDHLATAADATGGTAELIMTAGTLVVDGASVQAIVDAGDDETADFGGTARGGTARMIFSGGSATAASVLGADASAGDFEEGKSTGNAFGGLAEIIVRTGAAMTLTGALLDIESEAATRQNFSGAAGTATGGTARLLVEQAGLPLMVSNGLTIAANGFGARFGGTTGGAGVGGTSSVTVNDGVLLLPTDVAIEAIGFGGASLNGGAGTGGTADVSANGGLIASPTMLVLSAYGVGGDADQGGDGGIGRGGMIKMLSGGGVLTPSTRGLINTVALYFDASGTGGEPNEFGYGNGGGDGGAGFGGGIEVEARNGDIDITSGAIFDARGNGGISFDGGNGGAGTGGGVDIFTSSDTNGAGQLSIDLMTLLAGGFGASPVETGYGQHAGGSGGAGTGGNASLDAKAGGITTTSLTMNAEGIGASGDFSDLSTPGGSGSAGTGGVLFLGTTGGTLSLGSNTLLARGLGADGLSGTIGGSGGAGVGGAITVSAVAETLTINLLNADIRGTGGVGGVGTSGAGGDGGDATGGVLTLSAGAVDGELLLTSIFALTDAQGGDGGQGGSAAIGGAGGNGGDATGATYRIATNLGRVAISDPSGFGPSMLANAFGGAGAIGGDGSDTGNTGGLGGSGGNAFGGQVIVEANGGEIALGSTTMVAQGFGGLSAIGGFGAAIPPAVPIQAASGLDGRGTGGLVRIAAADGSGLGAAGIVTLGDTAIDVSGFFRLVNGNVPDTIGRAEIGDTGTAAGGGISIASLEVTGRGIAPTSDDGVDIFSTSHRITIANDAAIDHDGTAFFRAVGTGGLDVGGTLTVSSGWFIDVIHTGQPATPARTIDAGAVIMNAASEIIGEPGSIIFADGAIDLFANNTITLDTVIAGTDITITNSLTGSAFLAPEDASKPIDIATLVAGGSIAIDALGDATIGSADAGGTLSVITATTLTIGSASAGDDAILGGIDSVTAGSVTAGRDAVLVTNLRGGDTRILPRNVDLGTGQAGDDFIIAAFGTIDADSITTTGLGPDGTTPGATIYPDQPGSGVRIVSEMGARIGTIDAATGASLLNTAEFRNGFQISDGSGGIAVDRITAGGPVDITNSNSEITIDEIAAGDPVTLNALLDSVTVSTDLAATGLVTVTGTTVTLNAVGDIDIQDAIALAGALVVRSGGTIGISSDISAASIQLSSHDIVIAATANVGDPSVTDFISLTNSGTTRTFFGGASTSAGYSLSNDEFGRLSAHDINLFGTASANGSLSDVVVGQLDIIGSAGSPTGARRVNLAGSLLTIGTPGWLEVTGAVALTGAGVDDGLSINAGRRLHVVTPGGSIAITDAQGALGGNLSLSSPEIIVGSADAIADLASLKSIFDVSDRLGINDGPVRPEGYLQADAITLFADIAMYVQNSGASNEPGSVDRAGLTFGAGGLFLNSEFSGKRIVINGRQSNSAGFTGGLDLTPFVTIDGEQAPAGGYNRQSTINGCLILGVACQVALPEVPPIQDVIHHITDDDDDAAGDSEGQNDGTEQVQQLNLPLIQMVDMAGLSFEPLIDEPVTGAGNDDLWTDQ